MSLSKYLAKTTVEQQLILPWWEEQLSLKQPGLGVVISRWYNENYLKGNHKKYGAMILCNRDTENAAINIKIGGENVESKPYLGSISAALSCLVYPPREFGEERGLLSRTAAGNRA